MRPERIYSREHVLEGAAQTWHLQVSAGQPSGDPGAPAYVRLFQGALRRRSRPGEPLRRTTYPAGPDDGVEHALGYKPFGFRRVRPPKVDADGCFVLTLVSTLESVLREAWMPFLLKDGCVAKPQRQM
jgi:hypothetical protein